jgi:fructose-bisphosphate aldolase class II
MEKTIMTLVSIKNELFRARAGGYAVPLFDTFDMHTTEGMVQAIQAQRAPAIIAVYSAHLEEKNARALAAYIRTRAEEIDTPVSLMLDHGASLEQCIRAIRYGFTDVMYDGSKLPIAENIANTCAVVRAAHAVGVNVEAELGHVGSGSEYETFGAKRLGFTRPEDVERFAAETGVDFLAVAIGTAHGLYAGDPCLDMDLLQAVRSRVDIPLVMHGGTGLTPDQFRGAIAGGIAKINVATDLFVTAGKRMVTESQNEKASYFSLSKVARETFKERCEYYMELFGAAGRG